MIHLGHVVAGHHDVGRLRPEGASAGQGEAVEYLVMEHLVGETLADRLKKGPLPGAQAIETTFTIKFAI